MFKCPNCSKCNFSVNVHRNYDFAYEDGIVVGYRYKGASVTSQCNVCGIDLGFNDIEVEDGQVKVSQV